MAARDVSKSAPNTGKILSVPNILDFMRRNAEKLDKEYPLSQDSKGDATRQQLVFCIKCDVPFSHIYEKVRSKTVFLRIA